MWLLAVIPKLCSVFPLIVAAVFGRLAFLFSYPPFIILNLGFFGVFIEFLVKEYSGSFYDFCWDPDLLWVKPSEVDLFAG